MKTYVFLLKYEMYEWVSKLIYLPVVQRDSNLYYFYAYTHNKSVMKEFVSTRNMDLFRVEKLEIESDGIFEKHISSLLDYYELNSDPEPKYVLMTENEHDYIIYESLSDVIRDNIIDDLYYFYDRVEILQTKFLEAISELDVLDLFNEMLPFSSNENTNKDLCDYYKIFISVFGKLFK